MIDNFMGLNRWLSNFSEVDVVLDGETYGSVEHAYQAAKTDDAEVRRAIRECRTPGEAKKLGHGLRCSRAKKLRIMFPLLQQKFAQEPYRSKLAMTAGRELVEGNWWGDEFFGVCKGVGENWLGRMIMAIRDGKPIDLHPAGEPEQERLF